MKATLAARRQPEPQSRAPARQEGGARLYPLRHQKESFVLPGRFTELPEQACDERLKQDTGSLLGPGRSPFAWSQQAGFPQVIRGLVSPDSSPLLAAGLWAEAFPVGHGRQPGSWLAHGLGPASDRRDG